MKIVRFIPSIVLIFTLAFTSLVYGAKTTDQFNTNQKAEIEQIVRDYLIENPEILVEVSQVLQARQQEEVQARTTEAITENQKQVFGNGNPIVGNVDGKVNFVEFFDYQCIHCKRMQPVVEGLMSKNKDLRVIFKEFPIFGEKSQFASKAALAAKKQGKYLPLHNALMAEKKPLTQEKIMELAKSVGIDTKQLKKDMADPAIQKLIDENIQLATSLGIRGTPAFIVAANPVTDKSKPFFVPGAATQAKLQDFIQQSRQQ